LPPSFAAQELAEETPGAQPLLTGANLDRAIVARLIESPPASYPQPPFHYLLGCYSRASEALRGGAASRGAAAAEEKQRLHDLVVEARAQVVQYAVLLLSGSGVVPEVRVERGAWKGLSMSQLVVVGCG